MFDFLSDAVYFAQEAFPYEGSDPDEVHRIGQKIEHRLYVETINKLLQ